jgi:glycosyltransferase involved in cell wall biosynthesis
VPDRRLLGIIFVKNRPLPRIIFTVTNDLSYDQRMQRIAGSLVKAGYDTLLVGRKLRKSVPLQDLPFPQRRLRCVFDTGFLFYAEYNLRLFFFLLFRRADILCAIDLDTVLPVYAVSLFKQNKRVYDAHELFTEQKEVITRPPIYRFWLAVERFAVRRFPHGYTVNTELAKEFERRYGVNYAVVRNLPLSYPLTSVQRTEKFILYQGAVNEGRCFETLVPAMRAVQARLHIYGTGNFIDQAKQLVAEYRLQEKIIFHPPVLPADLATITRQAYIGLTLFEAEGMNQYHSLANRFFDYIMAGTPQVCVNYPAYAAINSDHNVAVLIADTRADTIAEALNHLLENEVLHESLQKNCLEARKTLNWEAEEQVLLRFYKTL